MSTLHPSMLEDTEPKRGPGRPKKVEPVDFDSLSDEMKVIHTYNDGGFDSSVCRALQFSKEEFDDKYKEDAIFRRLISFGRLLSQAWWEDKYREAANGNKNLNASMINFAMKNMFGWAEKSETINSDILNIEGLTRDETLQKIRELGPNILDMLEARERKAK